MKNLFATYRLLFKKSMLMVALLDLGFLLIGGYGLTSVMDKVAQQIVAMNMISGEITSFVDKQAITPDEISFLTSQQALFQSVYGKVLLLLFLQGVIFFVLWTVMEGFSWRGAAQAVRRVKLPLRVYYTHFAIVTLFFLVLLTIGVFLFGGVAVANALQMLRITSSATLASLFLIPFIALCYFWFVANSLIPLHPAWKLLKQSFAVGVRRAKDYLPIFVLVVVKGVLLYKIFVWLSQRYITLTFAYIFIILPLYLAWVKVANVTAARNMSKTAGQRPTA